MENTSIRKKSMQIGKAKSLKIPQIRKPTERFTFSILNFVLGFQLFLFASGSTDAPRQVALTTAKIEAATADGAAKNVDPLEFERIRVRDSASVAYCMFREQYPW